MEWTGLTSCVFLELAKAFDTVNHDILIWRLYSSGSQTVVRVPLVVREGLSGGMHTFKN